MINEYNRNKTELLLFIYNRLKYVYKENENFEYMQQLRKLTDVPVKPKPKEIKKMPKELKNDRDVLQALLDGETIEQLPSRDTVYGSWYLRNGIIYNSYMISTTAPKYGPGICIKSKTIDINGYDVPEPLREEPLKGTKVYCALSYYPEGYGEYTDGYELYLRQGFIHLTPEAAVLHKKALASFTTLKKEGINEDI